MKSEALDEIIRTTWFKNIILNWYCEVVLAEKHIKERILLKAWEKKENRTV